MRRITTALVIVLGLSLGGCSDTKEILGIGTKQAPDEFTVYSRAPLSMPPDFGLRPPAPGTARPEVTDPATTARRAMLAGRTARNSKPPQATAGTEALLRNAGAIGIDPAIREEVNRETSALVREDEGFTDSLLFWQKKDPTGEIIDPKKESERIKSNQALGEPVTTGETPVIERKEKGWLEGIFD
ncbi:DUF3035 domain-containing protein [Magnetospira sp. QH-2]|uniref:DUF3035 domain-containing protein n=1 Tax=Magnetospira sp. (strain QH-2) TaxID=1288970 RepID=UPI0003E80FED|nr:DUF3035 domain-containing protein [Magnetospira sp. QH-2]CCQ72294.1 conserved exported protein of unknown function [Magnetospira sp. QH-2]